MELPKSATFRFKKFEIQQIGVAHAVGTDGVLLGVWAEINGANRILDIGTGTGIIALMLAQKKADGEGLTVDGGRLTGDGGWRTGDGGRETVDEGQMKSKLTAIELHEGSFLQAVENFANSPWSACLFAKHITLQEFAQNIENQYDMIVSNPPFFGETMTEANETRKLGRYMGTLSLQELLTNVLKLLAPKGHFHLILPEKEGRQFCELATCQGLYFNRMTEVCSKKGKPVERLLLSFSRNPLIFNKGKLTILDEKNEFSIEYRALTKDFYLNF
jgi:tRNA1Val (adenine37-N6)-methyltransferase